jgi:hypothetical protein
MSETAYLEFKECAVCAAKPGSPVLCDSCLWNRWLVQQLKAVVASYRRGATEGQRIEARIANELEAKRFI